MARPRYSIGIDLGTSNSALAYVPLDGTAASSVLAVTQWDGPATATQATTLPSFLYLPDEPIAARTEAADQDGGSEWVVGRLALRKAGEIPGRVVQSAKSWLCHHAADRDAAFLPWGSDLLAAGEKISPVRASALILSHLRAAWDERFAAGGADTRFDAQDITITVPASFDAVAQRLTLAAARAAGFPEGTRLLEEPQAAFTWWLERHPGAGAIMTALPAPDRSRHHVLVVDIGGGTTDFSLFELSRPSGGGMPAIRRVAVSDHILLGGDNIDLALAHRLEPALIRGDWNLSPGQWDHLVARCRALKEQALGEEGPGEVRFSVSVPGRGAGLIAAALTAQVSRAEIETLILDGFFPPCDAAARPRRAVAAIKEWGLPYAADGAVTRHLADFLQGRPAIDAVLFNGGTLAPRRLRDRLRGQIGQWQEGAVPVELDNEQFDLAVARGAAYSGRLRQDRAGRIEAGSARAVFLEVHHPDTGGRALVCVLPAGALPGQGFELADRDLRLRLNQPVRFQIVTSTRHALVRVGEVIEAGDSGLMALPPLETVAMVEGAGGGETVAVALDASVNELGLLQVSCRSLDPARPGDWPLVFNLRQAPRPAASGDEAVTPLAAEPNVPPAAIEAAGARIRALFTPGGRDKPAAPRVLQALEKTMERPKSDWNGLVIRTVWTSLEATAEGRGLSVEHEETWLTLAGFLLRPGFGVALDEARIDALWRIRAGGLRFKGKRTRIHDHILWRRVAGGLSRDRQESLLAAEGDRLLGGAASASPELVRMAGAFERIGPDLKARLIERFLDAAVTLAGQRKHCAPYFAALGLMLNRTPFHAGPDCVAAPALVEQAFEALRGLDWGDPDFAELPVLFLRAARAVEDRRLDLAEPVRHRIASRLEKAGISATRAARVRQVVPVERAERLSLFGEALPPGLILTGA